MVSRGLQLDGDDYTAKLYSDDESSHTEDYYETELYGDPSEIKQRIARDIENEEEREGDDERRKEKKGKEKEREKGKERERERDKDHGGKDDLFLSRVEDLNDLSAVKGIALPLISFLCIV